MNNEGFTLVELLGVIAIVGILALVIGISVTSILRNSKSKLSDIQIESIEKAAKAYYLKEGMNESNIDSKKYSSCVEVQYLIDNDYIDASEIVNPIDNDEMLGSVKITYDSKKYKYTYQEKECSICKLVSGNKNEIGSKYQCKVKKDMEKGFEDGYYFYVLSHNNDGTTNLIMERNIYYDKNSDVGKVATSSQKGLVAWYSSSGSSSYGPVTAMSYLHNATKDWENIPNILMNYEDEGNTGSYGYGSIKTTGTTTIITNRSGIETGRMENLKARMPRYDEVTGAGKCGTRGNYGSCPLWLSNYLEYSGYVSGNHISEIYAYWTLSSSYSSAWYVSYYGSASAEAGVNDGSIFGVRPVITLQI